MTKHVIEVPRMGESISEATVGQLLVASGTRVKPGQELMELETDKVNQLIYAPVGGVVNWSVKSGDNVAVGASLGFIEISNEQPTSTPTQDVKSAQPAKTEKSDPAPSPKEEVKPAKAAIEQTPIRKTKEEGLKALQEEKREISAPKLSEPKAQTAKSQELPQRADTPSNETEATDAYTRSPLSRVRKVIAAKLVESQRTTATLTTFNEVDMSAVMALRTKYKDDFTKKYGTKLGFLSFFVKATVSALRAFPNIHAFIEGDDLILNHRYDISVAVGTDRGVLVPVLRNCDQLSFAQIEQTLEDLALRARDGTIKREELTGGSFTITNGGVYGSLLSTPILNTPQSGILGMHKIEERPIAVNGQVVIRPMMYLALSYDHRVADGKEAVSFLVHLKNCLEDPSRLLLNV